MKPKTNALKIHQANQEVINELDKSPDMIGQITVVFQVHQGGLTSYEICRSEKKKFEGRD